MEKFEEIEKKTNGEAARLITRARATRLLRDENGVNGVEYEKDGKTF